MSDYTRSKVRLSIGKEMEEMRKNYRDNGIPTILDESLNLLLLTLKIKNPAKILEIGTATGMSGICMLQASAAMLTTVEADENSYREAAANFTAAGLDGRVRSYLADAGEAVRFLDGKYDFIFLDGAKARYYDYLSDLKRLLAPGGVLFADNVLFRGFVECEKPPHREMTIVRNMRAFIDELTLDKNYTASVLDVGDGVLIAYKN